jgi:D-3-phosphoglycerate dehydrogenase
LLKVAVLSSAFSLECSGVTELLSAGVELRKVDRQLNPEAMLEALSDCQVVVAGTENYSAEMLARLSNLKLIARTGVGTEGIDKKAALARGVEIFTTPGVNAGAVAEHTLALLLSVLHKVVALDTRVRKGQWRDGSFYKQLSGLKVGVIGNGEIGSRFAVLAQAVGAKVRVYDPYREDASSVTSLSELLSWSEAVSLHVPLTDQTRDMLSKAELAQLPQGAILINTARGELVNEDSLYEALCSGHLGGAGLDVFKSEPVLKASRFGGLDNVVLSPHISSFSFSAITAMSNAIAEKIGEWLPAN